MNSIVVSQSLSYVEKILNETQKIRVEMQLFFLMRHDRGLKYQPQYG